MSTQGIKKLTLSNWLEPDGVPAISCIRLQDGTIRQMTKEEWIQPFLASELSSRVPDAIVKLFEVARGAMIYSYFFYPIQSLALEQLYRLAETSVDYKCIQLGSPSSCKTFQQKIDWLHKMGMFSDQDLQLWNAIRHLRNRSSHPESQTILSIGMVVPMLRTIADGINLLFDN